MLAVLPSATRCYLLNRPEDWKQGRKARRLNTSHMTKKKKKTDRQLLTSRYNWQITSRNIGLHERNITIVLNTVMGSFYHIGLVRQHFELAASSCLVIRYKILSQNCPIYPIRALLILLHVFEQPQTADFAANSWALSTKQLGAHDHFENSPKKKTVSLPCYFLKWQSLAGVP